MGTLLRILGAIAQAVVNAFLAARNRGQGVRFHGTDPDRQEDIMGEVDRRRRRAGGGGNNTGVRDRRTGPPGGAENP